MGNCKSVDGSTYNTVFSQETCWNKGGLWKGVAKPSVIASQNTITNSNSNSVQNTVNDNFTTTGPSTILQVPLQEERVYNNLADAFLRNDPQIVPVIKTYFPPGVGDQVFQDANSYITSNRQNAIEMAKTIGFARPDKKGDVSHEIAKWVAMMARAALDMRKVLIAAAQVSPSSAVSPTSPFFAKGHNSSLLLGLLLLAVAGGLAYFLFKRQRYQKI
jgi:hypothetical protein